MWTRTRYYSFSILYFNYMYVCISVCEYVYMSSARGGRGRMSDPPELELQEPPDVGPRIELPLSGRIAHSLSN